MLAVVDTIVEFEEMLKRGEKPTKSQTKEIKRCAGVANAMKALVRVQKD